MALGELLLCRVVVVVIIIVNCIHSIVVYNIQTQGRVSIFVLSRSVCLHRYNCVLHIEGPGPAGIGGGQCRCSTDTESR